MIRLLLLIKISLLATTAYADTALLNLTGNNGIFTLAQYHGNNYADINMVDNTNAGGTIYIVQKNGGDHNIDVDIVNNGGQYDIQLIQDSSLDLQLTVSQTCESIDGCTLAIHQY